MKVARHLLLLVLIILFFLFPVLSMEKAFLYGDNFAQFFPWFKTYAESIKNFHFPYWVRGIQCGFPLMAEGQIGGFYPLNILFFFILPFKAAYNYSIIFHFLLGGVSIFFLSKKLGSSLLGSLLAGVIFCFGSAYAGCFYNIITLRTLSWVPAVFLLLECYFEKNRIFYAAAAGIIMGLQFLAGFVQLAIYSWIFYLLYFIYKATFSKGYIKNNIFGFLLFSVVGAVIFLPQLFLTLEIYARSSRIGNDLQFALWGSVNPFLAVGAVFPYMTRFLRADFYASILGILFLVMSFYCLGKDNRLRPFFLVFLLAILLSLGKYNPLYAIGLKLTKLYGMRNPSKFLFFAMFSASILIGKGATLFFERSFDSQKRKAIRACAAFFIFCSVLFAVFHLVLVNFREKIIELGRSYVERYIYGAASHRYDLNIYFEKLNSIVSDAINASSFNNVYNAASWLLLVAGALFLFLTWKNKIAYKAYIKIAAAVIIIADLFIYSYIGSGFRGNLRRFDYLSPQYEKIYNFIKSDKDLFRILPYNISRRDLPNWAVPNANMAYGIDSIAVYTPLADDRYGKALTGLEVVDNSLGLREPSEDALDNKLQEIRLLNVKYLVTSADLEKSYLDLAAADHNIKLYIFKDVLPRIFISRELANVQVDSAAKIISASYGAGYASLKVSVPHEAYVVFSEFSYPGWKAYVNGKRRPIEAYFLIQTVKLSKGENEVKFIYE